MESLSFNKFNNNKISSVINKENHKEIFKKINKYYNEENNKSKTNYNFYYKIIPKYNIKTFISKFDSRNKAFYPSIKNIKSNSSNNYNKYYISSDIYHNDYISDYLTMLQKKKFKDRRIVQMKEMDNKIEQLAKTLYINQYKKIKRIYSGKLIDNEKTNDDDKSNINSLNSNETNKQNNNDIKFKTLKSNSLNSHNHKAKKIMIKGTHIISPFCDYARDQYLYKKIFYYLEKKKNLKSDSLFDNKLNIIYSENENQYKQNIIKLNEINKRIGKNKFYNLEPSQSETKLKTLKQRVDFMKRIVDYSYPNMVLTKIREQEKKAYDKNNHSIIDIVTSKVTRKNHKKFNRQISLGLKKSLSIQKYILDENKSKNLKKFKKEYKL